MNTFGFVNSKQTHIPTTLTETPYLILASEPEDKLLKRHTGLRYSNRLATKRTVFRNIRRELKRRPGIWYEDTTQTV